MALNKFGFNLKKKINIKNLKINFKIKLNCIMNKILPFLLLIFINSFSSNEKGSFLSALKLRRKVLGKKSALFKSIFYNLFSISNIFKVLIILN